MLVPYLFILLLGVGLGVLCIFLLLEEFDRPIRIAWLGIVGIVCAGYSLDQLRRPTPRRKSGSAESD